MRPVCVAKAMYPVQAGEVDSTACAGATGGSGAHGGQQPDCALQPSAAVARHGGQLCRCRQQSRGQESPVAGVWRQKNQSWLIAAVRNLRILLRHQVTGPVWAAATTQGGAADGARRLRGIGPIVGFRVFLGGSELAFAGLNLKQRLDLY